MLALRILSNLSGLFPLYTGRQVRNVLWYYCLASVITDASCLLLRRYALPFEWMANIFALAELILVGIFLHRSVAGMRYRLISLAALLAVVAYFVTATITTSVMKANMQTLAVLYLYFIVMLLLCFAKIIRDLAFVSLWDSPLFFFCVGFLVYSTGVLTAYLFSPYLLRNDTNLLSALWQMVRVLNIIKHTFIGYYFVLENSRHWASRF